MRITTKLPNHMRLFFGFFLMGTLVLILPTASHAQKTYMFWVKPGAKAKLAKAKNIIKSLRTINQAKRLEAKKFRQYKKTLQGLSKRWKSIAKKKGSSVEKKRLQAAWKTHIAKAKNAFRKHKMLQKQTKRLAGTLRKMTQSDKDLRIFLEKGSKKHKAVPLGSLLETSEANTLAQENPTFIGSAGASSNTIGN